MVHRESNLRGGSSWNLARVPLFREPEAPASEPTGVEQVTTAEEAKTVTVSWDPQMTDWNTMVRYNPSSVNAGGEEKGEVERRLCDFHVSMLAWFWNAKGREAADFIRAWATSRQDAQIEEAVRWIEEMLPIEAAVLLAMNDLAEMADAVRNDEALQLGKAPGLAEFPDEESFEERIRAAERCTALAEETGQADMEAESRCVASQLKLLRGIYCLSRAAAEADEEKKAEHLREVDTQIVGVVAAARAQTRAWRTMPASAAQKLDEFTEEFWRGAIASSV